MIRRKNTMIKLLSAAGICLSLSVICSHFNIRKKTLIRTPTDTLNYATRSVSSNRSVSQATIYTGNRLATSFDAVSKSTAHLFDDKQSLSSNIIIRMATHENSNKRHGRKAREYSILGIESKSRPFLSRSNFDKLMKIRTPFAGHNTSENGINGNKLEMKFVKFIRKYAHVKTTSLLTRKNASINFLCKTDDVMDHVELLMLITSSPLSTSRRDAIRRTWASYSESNKSKVRHVFVVGKLRNDTDSNNTALQPEMERYGDILQGDFIDSYYNLTTKTMFCLQWASKYCNHTWFVLKVDDDMWLNVPKLLNYLLEEGHRLTQAVGGLVIPSPKGKNKKFNRTKQISKLKNETQVFPWFCSGTAYVTTMKVVQDIVRMSARIRPIPLEDVYIGKCLEALNYDVISIQGFNKHKIPLDACVYKRKIISSHWMSPEELLQVWRASVRPPCR